jgi:hypothetical protein
MPVTEITWTEGEEVRTARIPEAELVFMCVAGEAERYRGYQSELRTAGERLRAAREAVRTAPFRELARARAEEEAAAKDFRLLVREAEEFLGRIKEACPYAGLYFMVRDGRLVGPVPRSEVLRRVLRPVRPPSPPALTPAAPFPVTVAPEVPFEVPPADRDAFFSWLMSFRTRDPVTGEETTGLDLFLMSDNKQRKRLYDNWRILIRGGRA